MKSLTALLVVAAALGLLLLRRHHLTSPEPTPPVARLPVKGEPQTLEPPSSPREEELRMAIAQAAARALRQWASTVSTCPACGATHPPANFSPRPAQLSRPGSGVYRSEVAGALEKTRSDWRRVYTTGPTTYEFTTFEQRIRCLSCNHTLTFANTDDPPSTPRSAPPSDPTSGPRRAFIVTLLDGSPAGRVLAGGGLPMTNETEKAASGEARAVVAIAALLLGAVLNADLAELPRADEVRRQVVDGQLVFHGAHLSTVAAADPAAAN